MYLGWRSPLDLLEALSLTLQDSKPWPGNGMRESWARSLSYVNIWIRKVRGILGIEEHEDGVICRVLIMLRWRLFVT